MVRPALAGAVLVASGPLYVKPGEWVGVFRKKKIMSLYCYFQFIFNVTGFLLTFLVLY